MNDVTMRVAIAPGTRRCDATNAVVDHPGRVLSDRLLAEQRADAAKQAAEAISESYDWGEVSRRPSHAEIARRRAEPGPLARQVDRNAAARWAAGEEAS